MCLIHWLNLLDTTEYIVTVSSPGGGCTSTDTVKVSKLLPPNTITLTGNASYCEGSGILSILHVNAADSIQWYKDDAAIPAAHSTDYTVTETGTYYAELFSTSGCIFLRLPKPSLFILYLLLHFPQTT
jgi:hypothetical protein